MITAEKLINHGFEITCENGLTIFTRNGFSVITINGVWYPCPKGFSQVLMCNAYVNSMEELERLISETQN